MALQFEFEQWARLAREAPEEFERRRAAAIEQVIGAAPARLAPRLRGLQFRLDAERRKARSPLGAVVRMQAMMWDQFEALRSALNALTIEAAPRGPRAVTRFRRSGFARTGSIAGKVLPFPDRE